MLSCVTYDSIYVGNQIKSFSIAMTIHDLGTCSKDKTNVVENEFLMASDGL